MQLLCRKPPQLLRWATIAIAIASCGRSSPPPAGEPAPHKVNALVIEARDIPVNFEYVAQTQSSHSVNIQARVAGFLDKRVYTEGEFVKLGQVLFEMDKKPFQAQLNAAQAALAQQEAALANARSNLARVKPLTALNALSQKDLDDAESSFQTTSASVEQAKAQLETAQLNLSYCTISSPLDGITSAARQQEGAYLDLSSSLLTTVSALTPMWVNFSLSENQLQSFNDQITRGSLLMPPDEKYIVHIIQTNGELFPYKGTITFKEPQFNPQTGTFLTRVNVDNPQGVLRPNQYVRVRIEGAVRPHAILIPQRAVQESAKGHYVWVVNEQKKAELRPVEVGDWQGENWFIADGLKSGEQVVLDGGMTLHAGDLVEIVSKDVQPLNNK